MDKKVKLLDLNPFITCNICKGYLVDATAITECLHTFCKSCIIKHLEADTNCPTCNIVVHHSYPRQYINFDRTMQDIVYKLVPGLLQNETSREREFYLQRGLPYLKDNLCDPDTVPVTTKQEEDDEETRHNQELISICLECSTLSNKSKKVFVRVPTKTTVFILKKFISKKFFGGAQSAQNIDIFCNGEILQMDDHLKYVYVAKWHKFDDVPLVLQCRPKYTTK